MAQNYTVGTAVLPARNFGAQGKGASHARAVPLTVEARKLLSSAEDLISRARQSGLSEEAFEFAHFAALRVAGAAIESVVRGAKSRKIESIWQKLSRVLPDFVEFAVIFEESAHLRTRLELGDRSFLTEGAEGMWISHAERFLVSAREYLDV